MVLSVGITGTRDGMSFDQKIVVRQFLHSYRKKGARIFHHGDCVGADDEGQKLARKFKYQIIVHPPNKTIFRAGRSGNIVLPERPYMERNHRIVRMSDLLLAVPKQEDSMNRSGTWATIRYARKLGASHIIIYPSGRVSIVKGEKWK